MVEREPPSLSADQPLDARAVGDHAGKLGEAVVGLVAARLLERAEETSADERRKEEDGARPVTQMLELAKMRNIGGGL